MAETHPVPRTAARRWRRLTASVTIAFAVALTAAPVTNAATTSDAWLAKVGSSGANGTATLTAYTTGTGRIVLKFAKLKASTTHAVTLLKTSCSGAKLLSLPSIKTTSKGAAARTSNLTASQVSAIKKATTGSAKIAVRVGTGRTAKCGVFAAQLVPAYVAGTVRVGLAPHGVAVAPSGVWVTSWFDNTLTRINPATNTVLGVVPIALTGTQGPESIVSGGDSLWLTTTDYDDAGDLATGSVLRVDPASGSVLATIPGGRGAFDIAYGLGAVWVPNAFDDTVQRIDPATNQVVATIAVPFASGVAVDATAVWVVSGNGVVSRIDPLTNLVSAAIPTQTTGEYIAVANGAVWVTNPGTDGGTDGNLTRINPATNLVVATIPLGAYPEELAVFGGSVWVGMGQESTIVRVNATTNAVISRVAVGYSVYSIDATDHAVWAVHNLVAADGLEPVPGLVTRIGF
jgi:YVTN family beta-propeller protein